MDIIVCINQVPSTTKVDIDEKTGVLKRDGVESKLNPYDLYAIETALRLKEQYGGFIRALTMGPPQAIEIIKEAYSIGVDEGFIMSDRVFAGADVLATSYTLSEGVKKLGKYDLIICGKQTTDGDTGQVGSEMAEFLDIPHIANVCQIIHATGDTLRVEADMADSLRVFDITFPCLITVEKDIYVPRLPSYKKKITGFDKEILIYSLADLYNTDPEKYGLKGSPTQVERIFPPETSNVKINVDGPDSADILFRTLRELKFI